MAELSDVLFELEFRPNARVILGDLEGSDGKYSIKIDRDYFRQEKSKDLIMQHFMLLYLMEVEKVHSTRKLKLEMSPILRNMYAKKGRRGNETLVLELLYSANTVKAHYNTGLCPYVKDGAVNYAAVEQDLTSVINTVKKSFSKPEKNRKR